MSPETPAKFVAYLLGRRAFFEYGRGYAAAENTGGADIAGAGSRSGVMSAKVKAIKKDFSVTDEVFADFRSFLDARKLKYTEEDLVANREAISREILEEVLQQAFGEGEARRRSMAWDPQVQKALELVPKAEQLLKDPQRFLAERQARVEPTAPTPQP